MFFKNYIYIVVVSFSFGFYSCKKPLEQKSSPPIVQENLIITPTIDPVLIETDNGVITKSALKKEIENFPEVDSSNTAFVVDEIIKRKLFLMEAHSMGLDTINDFADEVETYKKISLQEYFENPELIKALGEETYERYKYELNSSHIFVPLSWYASPEDTLKIYNDLLSLRDFALRKDNFSILAKEWSKDPKTNTKGGSLGWFTALHLIYPLEVAAYKTPLDSISLPVRTKAGYHIIKVNDKRPNSGYVKIQHIFKYLKADVSKETYEKTYSFLDSLKYRLEMGGDFNSFVDKYSDDFNSRENHGIYPVFGIGTREESTFEEAAFSLKKGEVSKPIRSVSGLHIIKLLERYKPDTKEAYLQKIKNKLNTDSRFEHLLNIRLKEIAKTFNLSVNEEILSQCLNYADEKILERKWIKNINDLERFVLFTIGDEKHFVGEYFDYILDRQSYEKWRPEETPQQVFRMLFEKLVNKKLIEYQEHDVVKKDPEIKYYFDIQKDNLLYSKFINTMIYEKSLNDTLGVRHFFERNPELFPTKENGTFSVMSFSDSTTYSKFKIQRTKEKPYQLNRGIKPIYFQKDDYLLGIESKRKIIGLISILKKNPGYIVEIGGHVDKSEDEKVSELRIKQIVDFLVENGLPLTRILEVNYKKSKVQDRFDWTKNQRVTFQFFSNYESDLVKVYNDKNPETIILKTYPISKDEFEKSTGLNWATQNGVLKNGIRIEEYSLKLKKNTRNFKDYKFDVVNKYQKYLEQELVTKLIKKYQANFDVNELNKIVEEVKNKK